MLVPKSQIMHHDFAPCPFEECFLPTATTSHLKTRVSSMHMLVACEYPVMYLPPLCHPIPQNHQERNKSHRIGLIISSSLRDVSESPMPVALESLFNIVACHWICSPPWRCTLIIICSSTPYWGFN